MFDPSVPPDPGAVRSTKQRLSVSFDLALDGQPHVPDVAPDARWWHRTGDTFETLTLTPSIDASAYGHWHGFITRGEVA